MKNPATTWIAFWLTNWLVTVSVLIGQEDHRRTAKFSWELHATDTHVSLRGLSAVDAKMLWACGAESTVIRSSDGGTSWINCSPNYETLEFRSITAFDAQTACIASAGTPAFILRTSDGGKNWQEVFKHASPAAFFDGLRFWDTLRGIAFSDPIESRILVVITNDGGITWQPIAPEAIPVARENEGGFAASNSALFVGSQGRAWIGTGGTVAENSRVYRSLDFGQSWIAYSCPIPSAASEGVFSLAENVATKRLVAVGGDFRPAATSRLTVAVSEDEGQTWRPAVNPPRDFLSAVCTVSLNAQSKPIFFATGPTGSFYSDDGDDWYKASNIGFHALASGPENSVFAVGSDVNLKALAEGMSQAVTEKVFAVGSEGRFGKLEVTTHPQ